MSPHVCRWISTKASSKSLPTSVYRKHLDGLTIVDVCWMPYGDHCVVRDFDLISCFSGYIWWDPVVVRHWPERVVWQFGYVQTIPPRVQCYNMKILTSGCISLTILQQWGRFVLCQDNVHQITCSGYSWFLIHSWHRHSLLIRPNIHLWRRMTHIWSHVSLRS